MKNKTLPAKMPLPLYFYRVFIKLFSFFVFGLGSIFMIFVIFPVLHIFFHKKQDFIKKARAAVQASFRLFVFFLDATSGASLVCQDKKKFKALSSCVVVANHPSLLDVVYLVSLVPNATCIVNTYLSHSIVAPIVKYLFILNTKDTSAVLLECKKSLARGNNLIIFPEGTRTPKTGSVPYKKGAAHIALNTNSFVVPIHIGGTKKTGLGKGESLFLYNREEKYVYEITMLERIDPKKYGRHPIPVATRLLTSDIENMLKR